MSVLKSKFQSTAEVNYKLCFTCTSVTRQPCEKSFTCTNSNIKIALYQRSYFHANKFQCENIFTETCFGKKEKS